MPLDANFLKTATEHFNPYSPDSGTEHVAMLLYSLVRMNRPKTVVEYGSGYSTMFVLRALADNLRDFEEEKTSLIKKTKELLNYSSMEGLTEDKGQILKWLFTEGKTCQLNPGFFLTSYEPKLYCMEDLQDGHEYVTKMRKAVEEINHTNIFTFLTGQKGFDLTPLNLDGRYIDLVWNDDEDYQDFFNTFWEVINPKGGLMIFHNAVSIRDWVKAIQWMIEQRSHAGDLEVLTLEEPHKLNQNGCVILRRTSEYSPSFHLEYPHEVLENISLFMNRYA